MAADSAQVDTLTRLLSPSELKRAQRYRFDRHRKAYILGRSTLRMLLSEYASIPAQEIEFEIGEFGKPALSNGSHGDVIGFNYSDAGGYALYGFVNNAEIGVDLESLNRDISYERILIRKFSSREVEAIQKLPVHMRKHAFLTCWTRKEGYGKAQGWGIRYSLDSIDTCVDCSSDRVEVHAEETEVRDWVVQQIYPGNEFVGCVVFPRSLEKNPDFRISYFTAEAGLFPESAILSEPL